MVAKTLVANSVAKEIHGYGDGDGQASFPEPTRTPPGHRCHIKQEAAMRSSAKPRPPSGVLSLGGVAEELA